MTPTAAVILGIVGAGLLAAIPIALYDRRRKRTPVNRRAESQPSVQAAVLLDYAQRKRASATKMERQLSAEMVELLLSEAAAFEAGADALDPARPSMRVEHDRQLERRLLVQQRELHALAGADERARAAERALLGATKEVEWIIERVREWASRLARRPFDAGDQGFVDEIVATMRRAAGELTNTVPGSRRVEQNREIVILGSTLAAALAQAAHDDPAVFGCGRPYASSPDLRDAWLDGLADAAAAVGVEWPAEEGDG